MKKIIFFQAHPDDLEFSCFHLLSYLCGKKKGKYDVKIASLTRGEYGWPKHAEHFKGERLGKLRTQELYNAMSTYGISKDNIHFFEVIDGHVFFNKELIEKIRKYLEIEKPDMIFACEPRNTFYRHPDHINTGKAVFYVLDKGMVDFKGIKPKLYFYSSMGANFFWPFRKQDIPAAKKNMHVHKSQMHIWKSIGRLYKLLMRVYGSNIEGYKYAEGYRRTYYGKEINKNKGLKYSGKGLLRLLVKAWPETVTRH